MFVEPSFGSAGPSGADDPAWLAAFGPSVYHDDNSLAEGSESLPALFMWVVVRSCHQVGVVEYQLGGLEAEAVVCQVLLVLVGVPGPAQRALLAFVADVRVRVRVRVYSLGRRYAGFGNPYKCPWLRR